MADNITAPATGAVLATDEIAGAHYPRSKFGFGADGSYTDVSTGTPLPVTVISGGGGSGGDASAANQVTEIARLTSIRDSLAGTLTVSASSLPLPTGAATATGVAAIVTALGSPLQAGGTVSVAGTVPVSGTFFQATQPVSATSLPLPSGAATSAKQDAIIAALGTPAQAGGKYDTVVPSVATSRSLVAGNSATQLMASNANRRGFSVQNQSASAAIYINTIGTATADQNSLMIAPGQLYESTGVHVGTGAVSIISTSASTPVYAREF